MQKIVSYVLSCLLGLLLTGCYENDSSAPDMVDPWLRERTPVSFRLESQIGAAVMASKGYTYRQILAHYFKDSQIEKIY